MKWEVQSQHMNAASGGSKNKILKLKNVQLILKGFRREKKILGGKISSTSFCVCSLLFLILSRAFKKCIKRTNDRSCVQYVQWAAIKSLEKLFWESAYL
jgi:hypothetical protein